MLSVVAAKQEPELVQVSDHRFERISLRANESVERRPHDGIGDRQPVTHELKHLDQLQPVLTGKSVLGHGHTMPHYADGPTTGNTAHMPHAPRHALPGHSAGQPQIKAAAAAFGAVLYTVVTGDSIVNALTKIIDKALSTSV